MKVIIFTLLLLLSNSLGETGIASWYSIKTNKGHRTASGVRLNNAAFTAAHKTIKLGTKVKVINLQNGKSITCTILDRGPYIRGRIIDLTIAGAKALGFYEKGLTKVKIEIIK